MRTYRFSLASLMGLVVLCALGVVGLRESTYPWAAATFYATVLTILAATLLGATARGPRRATRLGFALFAASYLVLMLASPHAELRVPHSPVTKGLDAIDARLHPEAPEVVSFDYVISAANGPQTFQNVQVNLGPGTTTLTPGWALSNLTGAITASGSRADHDSFRAIGHSLVALVFGAVGGLWAGLLARRQERKTEACPAPLPIDQSSENTKQDPAA